MTREERLSLAIATFHEPMPTWPKGYHNEHARTPGDWWRAGLDDDGLPCWKPHVDPMRLLKELPSRRSWEAIRVAVTWGQTPLEVAIAEEFARSNRVEVE